MSAAQSKRRFRRRTLRLRVDFQLAGETRRDWATTLGAGGMFIETEAPAATGTRLKLSFQLPGGRHTHKIEGRVAWTMGADVAAGTPTPTPGMGIEFTDAVASAALARELERDPPG